MSADVQLKPRAFSLVEMLVVIGIIGVLLGLIVPVMASFKAESYSAVCLTNMRQIFTAIETSRQQNKDLLPFAAPLPVPSGQMAFVPGLPEKLKSIMPREAETWMCPADESEDSAELGTSYSYAAGAWMLLEYTSYIPDPNNPPPTQQALINIACQRTTGYYTNGFLRAFPLLGDTDGYHDSGSRQPWNAVFIDGNARVMKQGDEDINVPNDP